MIKGLRNFAESVSNIGKISLIDLKDIKNFKFPKIEIDIPKIELPKFDIFKIDYDDIREIVACNAKFGWTLTKEMAANQYLNEDILGLSKNEIDLYYLDYYRLEDKSENIAIYKSAKVSILDNIETKWVDLLEECFKCHENGFYKVAIPNLIAIIEGEVSSIAQSDLIGSRLLVTWKKNVDSESDKLDAIAIYSLLIFLQESLFLSRKFDEDRPEVINRNWVLHGRDNPEYWHEVDYYRLVNTLSSIQFVKEIINNESQN